MTQEPAPIAPRIAVLASGGGSNFNALCEHLVARGVEPSAWIRLVASDRAAAPVIQKATERGIENLHLDNQSRTTGLKQLLQERAINLLVLAGYLKLVPGNVIDTWAGRIVNVHPSLLPSFGGHGMYGRRVHEAVIAAGARVTGVTVHFVNNEYDRGPMIAQWPVPVAPEDDPDTLAARVLEAEHQLYPRIVELVALGEIRLQDGRVLLPENFPDFPHFAASDEAGASDAWGG